MSAGGPAGAPASVRVPDTVAATLAPDVLGALEQALAPAPELRVTARVEVEIDAVGEGTFTLTLESGRMAAKKGFARDPLISVVIPRGGWSLVRAQLQAAVEGFPSSPELRRQWEALRAPRPGELDALVGDLKKLKDAAARIEVKGMGAFAIARGPVDEATRVLKVAVDGGALQAALGGRALADVRFDVSGDRSVLTAVASALAPALKRMTTTRVV